MNRKSLRKVIVVGSGAREHALSDRLLRDPSVGEVIVVPGNAGTAETPAWAKGEKGLRNSPLPVLEVARQESVDLVVVGPEAPLCAGLVDELRASGIRAFGPNRAAARLEGSKAFMKEFALRHRMPTARARVVRRIEEVRALIDEFEAPPVVKADGLCAGKGVILPASHADAERAAVEMLSGRQFGASGHTVVLEERVLGFEVSAHAICDGERFIMLPLAQDHKRLLDGDRGPNTGGMGSYAPTPLISAELEQRIRQEIFGRALHGMAQEGQPFRGVLFAGLMITDQQVPILLEFNVRFGDPETQVLMALIEGDFANALDAAASGRLGVGMLRANSRASVCVVVAAEGYPERPRSGDIISGVHEAEASETVRVFHAGTVRNAGQQLVTAGGRVLGVTANAPSLGAARALAYRAVDCIKFGGMQFRSDIAVQALEA